MATVTAIITAGGAHPNDGGIIPAATLTLWENSTPRWRLDHADRDDPSVAWVPRAPETFLEDALLLLAAVGIRDERVIDLLDDLAAPAWCAPDMNIAEVIGAPDDDLRAAVRDAMRRTKLVVTVVGPSTIEPQLELLTTLETDVEICLPNYWRRSSQWQAEPEVGGHLP